MTFTNEMGFDDDRWSGCFIMFYQQRYGIKGTDDGHRYWYSNLTFEAFIKWQNKFYCAINETVDGTVELRMIIQKKGGMQIVLVLH